MLDFFFNFPVELCYPRWEQVMASEFVSFFDFACGRSWNLRNDSFDSASWDRSFCRFEDCFAESLFSSVNVGWWRKLWEIVFCLIFEVFPIGLSEVDECAVVAGCGFDVGLEFYQNWGLVCPKLPRCMAERVLQPLPAEKQCHTRKQNNNYWN